MGKNMKRDRNRPPPRKIELQLELLLTIIRMMRMIQEGKAD